LVIGGAGPATAFVRRRDGAADEMMPRTTQAAAGKFQNALLNRIGRGAPDPKTQAAVTHAVTALLAGKPDYSQMEPELARRVRAEQSFLPQLQSLGPIQSLAFSGVGPTGNDVYIARHADGASRWAIGLGGDGKIRTLQASSWP